MAPSGAAQAEKRTRPDGVVLGNTPHMEQRAPSTILVDKHPRTRSHRLQKRTGDSLVHLGGAEQRSMPKSRTPSGKAKRRQRFYQLPVTHPISVDPDLHYS